MWRLLVLGVLPFVLSHCGGKSSADEKPAIRRQGAAVTSGITGTYLVQPSLSADGQSVLYQSNEDGKLYFLQQPLGSAAGTPQAVVVAGSSPKWLQAQISPDGLHFVGVAAATTVGQYSVYLCDFLGGAPALVYQGAAQIANVQFSSDSLLFMYTLMNQDGTRQSFIGRTASPTSPLPISPSGLRGIGASLFTQNGQYQILLQGSDLSTLKTAYFVVPIDATVLDSDDAFRVAMLGVQNTTLVSNWTQSNVMSTQIPIAQVSQTAAYAWAQETSPTIATGLGTSPALVQDGTLGFLEYQKTPLVQLSLNSDAVSALEWPLGIQTIAGSFSRVTNGLGLLVDQEFHLCDGSDVSKTIYGTGFVLRIQDAASGAVTKTWMFPTTLNVLMTDPCLSLGNTQSLRIKNVTLNANATQILWRGVFQWVLGTTAQQGVIEVSAGAAPRIFFFL